MGNQDAGMGERRGRSVAKSVPLDGGPLFMIRFRVVILVCGGGNRKGCDNPGPCKVHSALQRLAIYFH